jgi:hypothetical protein
MFYFAVAQLPSNLSRVSDGDHVVVHLRLHADRFEPVDFRFHLHVDMAAREPAHCVLFQPVSQASSASPSASR